MIEKSIANFFDNIIYFFDSNPIFIFILIGIALILLILTIVFAALLSKNKKRAQKIIAEKNKKLVSLSEEIKAKRNDDELNKKMAVKEALKEEETPANDIPRRAFLDYEAVAENLISRGDFGVAARFLAMGSSYALDPDTKKRMDIREVECLVYDKKYYEASKKAMDMVGSQQYILSSDESRKLFALVKSLID